MDTSDNRKRILIVDDDEDWRDLWKVELKRHGGFVADEAESIAQAIRLLEARQYDGAIIDKGGRDLFIEPSPHYEYHDGLRLIAHIKENYPLIRVVLQTGESFSRSVFECGACIFLNKGWMAEHCDEVVGTLEKGCLLPDEIGAPIIYLGSENAHRRRGIERW